MNTKDPKLIALHFNECIHNQDLNGLSLLMSDDHAFIDREGTISQPKSVMLKAWKQFFDMFPRYRNTFNRVQSKDNHVAILGFAYWSDEQPYDPVIWTATIVNDLVQVWQIHDDTDANRNKFGLH